MADISAADCPGMLVAVRELAALCPAWSEELRWAQFAWGSPRTVPPHTFPLALRCLCFSLQPS